MLIRAGVREALPWSTGMASKGVDYYTFSSNDYFSVNVTGPKVGGVSGPSNNFRHQNFQIDSGNISGILSFDGTLAWQALQNGAVLLGGSQEISSLTGNLGGGSMANMLKTPSTVTSGYAVSYGFYDAGPGVKPLTDQDQLYVYVTDSHANWMGTLAEAMPALSAAPLNSFVLPGAHDAGMFTLSTVTGILAGPDATKLLTALSVLSVFGTLLGDLTMAQAPRAIANLALTQKDTIPTMLDLGIRYFDYRPGTLYPKIASFNPGVRYHQHSVIPGYAYVAFLQDVIAWLDTHPTEIVVVSANTQGFSDAAMKPTAAQVQQDLDQAIANVKPASPLVIGDKTALTQSYAQLVASHTRLIFLNQIEGETSKYDSYNDGAYATVDPATIIGALAGMNAAGQKGHDYTVLQMQGTATSAGNGVIAAAVTSLSDASSPLLSTKGRFDAVTNPWLLENVPKNLSNDQLVVLLNDFADNGMTQTAIDLTRARVAQRA